MSVESKIKELLGRANAKEQLVEEAQEDLTEAGIVAASTAAAGATKKDNSKAGQASNAGDTTQPMQGSSQKASFTTRDEDEENQGAKSAAAVSKDNTLPTSKGDAKSVKTPAMEETAEEGETIAEEQVEEQSVELDVKAELGAIFGEDLSEEFKTKATSIFEAAVIARVNAEMDKITTKLEEQNASQLVEFKDTIVEKVDSYLNYIVEQWMKENQIAIENGLRTEIAEDFISGLKNLFKESYIEVPEEKYDVLGEMSSKIEELEKVVNESIEDNVALSKEIAEMKKAQIFEEQTKELAATEVEKLKKLVEGVEFDTEDLYREKVSVIKENYFPKATATSPEQMLVEETGNAPAFEDDSAMSHYVQAISRSIAAR